MVKKVLTPEQKAIKVKKLKRFNIFTFGIAAITGVTIGGVVYANNIVSNRPRFDRVLFQLQDDHTNYYCAVVDNEMQDTKRGDIREMAYYFDVNAFDKNTEKVPQINFEYELSFDSGFPPNIESLIDLKKDEDNSHLIKILWDTPETPISPQENGVYILHIKATIKGGTFVSTDNSIVFDCRDPDEYV